VICYLNKAKHYFAPNKEQKATFMATKSAVVVEVGIAKLLRMSAPRLDDSTPKVSLCF
jgi:hypothetical protein